MRYLALGDATSIDDYTGTEGGGAASQFARLIGADVFLNRAYDGYTADGVIQEIESLDCTPDIVTVTVGGNDFLAECYHQARARDHARKLMRRLHSSPLTSLQAIAGRLAAMHCTVLFSTIYDPTDAGGCAQEILGIPETVRSEFDCLNEGIVEIARANGFVLADIHALFLGHGAKSDDTWLVADLDPSLIGATKIANYWYALYQAHVSEASSLPREHV